MPTLGSTKLIVRVPDDLRDQVFDCILQRNTNSREEPWTLSDFVRISICEKLAKMERSRGGRGRGKKPEVIQSVRLELETERT